MQKMTENESRRVVVDILFIIFGLSAWVAVNGIYVELPVLVDILPESWDLPSYVTLISQLANVYPLVYGILHKMYPKRVRVTCAVYFVLMQGLIASFLLIFLWDKTAIINDQSHSIGLFVLLFFLAMVDCTSKLTFLPFVCKFKAQYVITYLLGEGLSGFLPAVVALGQGVGGNPYCKNVSFTNVTVDGNFTQWHLETIYNVPRFSATIFFSTIFIMICASTGAFLLLNFLRIAKAERIRESDLMATYVISSSENANVPETTECSIVECKQENLTLSVNVKMQPGKMKMFTYYYLLSIQAYSSMLLYGFLLSIQSYSCLPYGNTAFHVSVVLSNMAVPLASFVAIFIAPVRVTVVTIHIVIGTIMSVYIFAMAAMSPAPPLLDSGWGSSLIVIAWLFCCGFVSYARVGVANILRSQGQQACFWIGVVSEIGSLIGAVIIFLMVNIYKLFESYYPCK